MYLLFFINLYCLPIPPYFFEHNKKILCPKWTKDEHFNNTVLPPLFVHSSLNKPQSIPVILLWNRVAITGAPYFPYFTSSKSPLNGHFHLLITTWFHQPQALYQCLKDYFPSHCVIDWIIQLISNMSTVIYEVKTLFNRKDTKNTNLLIKNPREAILNCPSRKISFSLSANAV